MENDNSKKVTSVINSIPFGNIIGGPLSACIAAQKEAAWSTLQYLRDTTMVDSNVEYGASEPINVSFTFVIEGVKKVMVIPLLTIVPIPYIHIDHVDLSFTANITSCSDNTIKAAYTAPSKEVNSEAEQTTNLQNLIQVDIHATTSDMPPGVAKLLDLFGNQLIQVETVPAEEVERLKEQTRKLRELDKLNKLRKKDMDELGYISFSLLFVTDLPGVGKTYADKLEAKGITMLYDYFHKARTTTKRQQLQTSTGISHKLILRWSNLADLLRVPGMTPAMADLLEASGVDTVKELKRRTPAMLQQALAATNRTKHIMAETPTMKQVKDLVENAKKQPDGLEY